jgi:glutamine amidotransferase
MIGIIDYEAGNIASVTNALNRLSVNFIVTNQIKKLEQCEGYIFPGVGHAYSAMRSLDEHNLIDWMKDIKKPLLGICLGMQLLFEESEEGSSAGLGVIPGKLRKFDSSRGKVPHMGWNTFTDIADHDLLRGIRKDDYFYYVHSYYAPVNQYSLATCDYISTFASVVANNNFLGVQFHPEKSGSAGEHLLSNFLTIVKDSSPIAV